MSKKPVKNECLGARVGIVVVHAQGVMLSPHLIFELGLQSIHDSKYLCEMSICDINSAEIIKTKDCSMKKVVTLATALCLASMPALAGNMSPAELEAPVQAPVIPVAGSSAGNTGLIAAGAGLLVLAALAASGSSSSTATTTE